MRRELRGARTSTWANPACRITRSEAGDNPCVRRGVKAESRESNERQTNNCGSTVAPRLSSFFEPSGGPNYGGVFGSPSTGSHRAIPSLAAICRRQTPSAFSCGSCHDIRCGDLRVAELVHILILATGRIKIKSHSDELRSLIGKLAKRTGAYSRNCQTSDASPAKPGILPIY